MTDKVFFDRINRLDKLISDWMVKGNIVETTPAAVMELLIVNGIYMYDNRNGKPFRDDIRQLRDNGILHLFRYIEVQQGHKEGPWHIYRKRYNAYDAILDREIVIKFFGNNKALSSVLSKNRTVSDNFFKKYGKHYKTVSEYYNDNRLSVNIIDLKEDCPQLFS
jgi:hypothetical protein